MISDHELPSYWVWRTLGAEDGVSVVNPHRPSIVRSSETPTSFVPMQNVSEVDGRIVKIDVRPYGEVRTGYTYFEEGDVLFAKITPSMQNGKSAIAQGLIDGFGFGTTEFHVLRPMPGILAEWIHLFVRQARFRMEAMQHFRGAVGQQRVPQDFIENYPIPLPYPDDPTRSLAEQRRIVARIEALFAELGECRRLHGEIVADTGRLMDAVRHEVFTKLTAESATKSFDEIAESRLGKMLSQDARNGEYMHPYLRNANVQWDEFRLDDLYEMNFPPEDQEKFSVRKGDLLICEGGEIGRTAVWDRDDAEIYFQKALHRARLRNPLAPPRYLMHFLAWAAKNGEIAKLMTGAAIPHLTGVKLKTLAVTWPDRVETMREVVSYLDSIHSEILAMQGTNQSDEFLLSDMEQSILTLAFRGEL